MTNIEISVVPLGDTLPHEISEERIGEILKRRGFEPSCYCDTPWRIRAYTGQSDRPADVVADEVLPEICCTVQPRALVLVKSAECCAAVYNFADAEDKEKARNWVESQPCSRYVVRDLYPPRGTEG